MDRKLLDPAAMTTDLTQKYESLLATTFGHASLRETQVKVLAALEEGDVFAISPTGSGKSMLYVLPALRGASTIVVSPHIALMQDQVESLRANGVSCGFANSTQSLAERQASINDFIKGRSRLLYVAPESLANRRLIDTLLARKIDLFAIDEAHCVSEWGHTFRPDYLRLADVRLKLKPKRTLALTATATSRARSDIAPRLGLSRPTEVIASVRRSNLGFSVINAKSNKHKEELLSSFVKSRPNRRGIVYVGTIKSAKELAELLQSEGIRATSYYGGTGSERLPSNVRAERQRQFMRDEVDVIVATNAFGLGVDKPDVRYVLHYDMPSRLEAYYQEAGRAGRDGEPAECALIHTQWSKNRPQFFIDSDHPDDRQVLAIWQALLQLGDDSGTLPPLQEHSIPDGHVMAIQAFVESDLLSSDEKSLLSKEDNPRVNTQRITTHRQFSEQMLNQMNNYATTSQCRVSTVLSYFGESNAEICGLCDNCVFTKKQVSRRSSRPISTSARAPQSSQQRQSTHRPSAKELANASARTEQLFERLKVWRTAQAAKEDIPPFVVFQDGVLTDLAMLRPSNLDELMRVPGVGIAKIGKYGSAILAELRKETSRTSAHSLPSSPSGEAGSSDNEYKHRLAEIKQKSPNAYEPWTADQDEQLRTMLKKQTKIKQIAEVLGRQESAIRSRVKKLDVD